MRPFGNSDEPGDGQLVWVRLKKNNVRCASQLCSADYSARYIRTPIETTVRQKNRRTRGRKHRAA